MASTSSVAYCLSDTDVKRIAGRTGLLITKYPDLADFENWNEFMSNRAKAAAVLFLVQSESSGHWMAAFNGPDNTAHVWDPLGLPLDKQREVISSEKRSELGEKKAEFARLLATATSSGMTASVNHTEFQEFGPSINTCGRWVGMRILHRNKTDAEFKQLVESSVRASGCKTPDEWIVVATNPKVAGGSLTAWDDTFNGGAFDAFYDKITSNDARSMKENIVCEIDRVGVGGSLAKNIIARVVDDATFEGRLGLTDGASKAEVLRQWSAVASKKKSMSGGEFWSALTTFAKRQRLVGGRVTHDVSVSIDSSV